MFKIIYTITLVGAVTLVTLSYPALTVHGLSLQEGANTARGVDQPVDIFGTDSVFSNITNMLLFLIGAISVIMLIIGGLRYVLSGGDQAKVTAAKNTILYAIIGVIVAILAFAIVEFVITSLTDSGAGGALDV